MTREEAKVFLPIIQAFAEGRVIECRTKPSLIEGSDVPNDWTEMKEIGFWNNIEYRIKPEPNYRAFINKEECWDEMHKHPDFGWIVAKDSKIMYHVGVVGIGYVVIDSMSPIFSEAFADYEFTDGKPFGIKEE